MIKRDLQREKAEAAEASRIEEEEWEMEWGPLVCIFTPFDVQS